MARRARPKRPDLQTVARGLSEASFPGVAWLQAAARIASERGPQVQRDLAHDLAPYLSRPPASEDEALQVLICVRDQLAWRARGRGDVAAAARAFDALLEEVALARRTTLAATRERLFPEEEFQLVFEGEVTHTVTLPREADDFTLRHVAIGHLERRLTGVELAQVRVKVLRARRRVEVTLAAGPGRA